jgi:hypothetical protein
MCDFYIILYIYIIFLLLPLLPSLSSNFLAFIKGAATLSVFLLWKEDCRTNTERERGREREREREIGPSVSLLRRSNTVK